MMTVVGSLAALLEKKKREGQRSGTEVAVRMKARRQEAVIC